MRKNKFRKYRRFRMLRLTNSLFRIWAYRRKHKEWPMPEISCEELQNKMNNGENPILLDVRMKSFFNTRYGHIETAKLYPSLKLMKSLEELYNNYKDDEVIVMCYGGGLSLMVADILMQVEFTNVKSLFEGTDKWNQLGYPTVFDEGFGKES